MALTTEQLAQAYLAEVRHRLAENVSRIKHCLNQLDDEQIWWRPQESMNSIANLVLHLCGNIGQRILSTVGGEPDTRDRPREFTERGPISQAQLIRRVEDVIARAEAVLARLTAAELIEARRYQGLGRVLDGTVLSVIFHCLLHLSGHAQEIIYITRLQLGDSYKFQVAPSPANDPSLD